MRTVYLPVGTPLVSPLFACLVSGACRGHPSAEESAAARGYASPCCCGGVGARAVGSGGDGARGGPLGARAQLAGEGSVCEEGEG
eukprot:2752796-Pleurochrysis_carterae.AAC.1